MIKSKHDSSNAKPVMLFQSRAKPPQKVIVLSPNPSPLIFMTDGEDIYIDTGLDRGDSEPIVRDES